MEHFTKILGETRVENNNLWKYDFLNVQSNQTDCFYHDKKISYKPDIIGKLELTRDKLFKSFNQEINDQEVMKN